MIKHRNNEPHRHSLLWIASLAALLWISPAAAQELTPRAYWPAPEGTKVFVLGYQYSAGDIVTDPSLPVTGVDSKINYALAGFVYNFDLVGRTANVQINLPYTWGESEGFAEGEFRRRVISGLTDLRARLSVNLLGAPTMDVAEFQQLRANPRPIIGASFQVQMPTGDYDADKLLNAGVNRWAVKPAVGFILPIRPDLAPGVRGRWLVHRYKRRFPRHDPRAGPDSLHRAPSDQEVPARVLAICGRELLRRRPLDGRWDATG